MIWFKNPLSYFLVMFIKLIANLSQSNPKMSEISFALFYGEIGLIVPQIIPNFPHNLPND